MTTVCVGARARLMERIGYGAPREITQITIVRETPRYWVGDNRALYRKANLRAFPRYIDSDRYIEAIDAAHEPATPPGEG